jgi:hypothetical protein
MARAVPRPVIGAGLMFTTNRILARGDTQSVGEVFFLPRRQLKTLAMTPPIDGSFPPIGFEGYSNHGWNLACGQKAL